MRRIFLVLSLIFSTFLFAQVKQHTVKPKETLYGISKQYNVSQQALINANSFLKERSLQEGDLLTIPNEEIKNGEKPYSDENYIYVEIQPKETLYNLTKKYNISEEALKSLNPSLTNGLKIGDVIRVPVSVQKENLDGYHKVQAGETLYSISKKYNTTVEDLLMANRDLQVSNVQIGAYVKIPQSDVYVNNQPVKENPPSKMQDGYYKYTVQKDDTVFSLLNKFNISLEEFLNANPNITSGITVGQEINIPIKSASKFNKSNNSPKDDTIRVAMFLPFYLNDDTKKAQKDVATFFLSGAKLALDSLSRQGKKIIVNIYDSGSSASFTAAATNPNLKNSNLIVGPFYKSNIIELSQYLEEYQIPIVSPIVIDKSLKDLPNIILTEVEENSMADAIIQEVLTLPAKNKIYIVATTDYTGVGTYLQQKLSASGRNAVIVNDPDLIQQQKNLATDLPESIVPILVSDNENVAQKFINKINDLDDNATSPYSLFYLNAFDTNANIDKLRKKGFVFVTPRKVNTQGKNEKITLKKYQDNYCQSPPKYAVYGFDIVYDLISRMDNEKNITDHLANETTQLATRFKYEKLPSNSFQNVGLRIIRYAKY